jgi:hypothetical protein
MRDLTMLHRGDGGIHARSSSVETFAVEDDKTPIQMKFGDSWFL